MCTAMLSYWEIDGYWEFELRSSYLHDSAFPAEPSPEPLYFIFAAATQLGLSPSVEALRQSHFPQHAKWMQGPCQVVLPETKVGGS